MHETDTEIPRDMNPPFTDPSAPKAPFRQGKTPRAAWYCIEVAFRHPSPHPEAIEEALGRAAQYEYADAGTLAHMAAVFAAQERGGRGLLVTRDHSAFQAGGETRATGWIKDLHAEGDKLWAWIEWTPYGHALVDGAEFVHFSTEYEYADFRITPHGAEPQRLAACTLTNEPRHRGQTPCTNSAVQPQTMKTNQTTMKPRCARNSGTAEDDDRITTPAATTNAQGEEEEPTPAAATNTQQQQEDTAATNSDDDPTAMNGDEAAPAGMTLEEAVETAAELLGLPDDATPEDFLAAIRAAQESIAELRAALEEAGTATNGRRCNSRTHRYTRLTARNAGTCRLTGGMPNRAVHVAVGGGMRAVNTQDKALADYCRRAVEGRERSLGRALNAAEYATVYAAARRDYHAGVNR